MSSSTIGTPVYQATTSNTTNADSTPISSKLVTGMVVTDSPLMFRNRIINGDMRIDQRNAGAAVTPIAGATYLVDRFALETSFASKLSFRQVSNVSTDTNYEAGAAPSGFTHSLKISVAASYVPTAAENCGLFQQIEGLNIADLAWGTADAKPVAISFWVKGSITGKYTVHVRNTGETRTFLSTVTINTANTWEYKTITVPGCTDGTWAVNNTRGILLAINLGAGSNFKGAAGSWLTTAGTPKLQTSDSVDFVSQINGSTLYITGVQLEADSATPFERRPYGVELGMCQRYYEVVPFVIGTSASGVTSVGYYKVTKRDIPVLTTTIQAGTGGSAGNLNYPTTSAGLQGFGVATFNSMWTNAQITASAEL